MFILEVTINIVKLLTPPAAGTISTSFLQQTLEDTIFIILQVVVDQNVGNAFIKY